MNPIPMVIADMKALRWTALAIVALVALAVAVGVAINAQERGLRKSSAAAADDFDLLIGAPGSQTQLMLTTVFLQQEAMPLMDGAVLRQLASDKRVRAMAPIAPGDVSKGYPIIGTTADFATRWGRIAPRSGRIFSSRDEAVIGADVDMAVEETILPSHAVARGQWTFGMVQPDEAEHKHEGSSYTVVGKLPRLGTPWDRAILVPLESVWATHGLGHKDHHPRRPAETGAEEPSLGTFLTTSELPGVPAIIVKPKSIADAYALRAAYRQNGTMAFFPAEVLVSLYGTMGDIRDVLVAASVLNTVLIFSAVLLLFWAIAGLRRGRYAVLRALGAPRHYILLLVWLNALALLASGCAAGLVLGWSTTFLMSHFVDWSTGLRPEFVFSLGDVMLTTALIFVASVMSLMPALMSYNAPIIAGLRSGN